MTPTLPDVPKVEAAIIEMTNAYRRDHKLGDVKPNARLKAAAEAYARFLAASGQFSHTADGRQPADRVQAAGYAYCLVVENLAMFLDSRGFETRGLARQTVDGWINSPPHRHNLEQPHVTEIGVGVAKAPDKNPKYIAVQLFGRPEALKTTVKIENRAGVTVQYSFGGKSTTIAPNVIATHTSCEPGRVEFLSAGSLLTKQTIDVGYFLTDGAVYTLKPRAGGGVGVEPNAAGKR